MFNDRRDIPAWLLFLAAMLFLGRFELHTDDSGVVAFLVLLFAFLLGCLHPRRAWLWSMTGWSVPAADLFRGSPAPDVHHIPGPLLLLPSGNFLSSCNQRADAIAAF